VLFQGSNPVVQFQMGLWPNYDRMRARLQTRGRLVAHCDRRIDDRAGAYATRAAAARGGLFGNHGYEADHE